MNPPIAFSGSTTFTIPSGFNADDATGIIYDDAGNRIAMFFRNGSYLMNDSIANLQNGVKFSPQVYTATYNKNNIIGNNLTETANITLQTRVSNDSSVMGAWTSLSQNSGPKPSPRSFS